MSVLIVRKAAEKVQQFVKKYWHLLCMYWGKLIKLAGLIMQSWQLKIAEII